MSEIPRVFCQQCGEPLRIWHEPDFPYDQWLATACPECGTKPTDSRYQDSDIFLASPMAGPLGAVALTFEQLATSLRLSISTLCFDGQQSKNEIAEAMLSPLSYSEQVRVFSAVFLTRFPDREAEVKRMRRRLESAGEARNRVLHAWWLPGTSFFETGTRVSSRISGGKLKRDMEEVSIRELTHLAAYFNKLQSDLLQMALGAAGLLPKPGEDKLENTGE